MIENEQSPLKIMLADDDRDDRFFFDKALKVISIPTTLATVEDGAMLMNYLHTNTNNLPDVLFLDLNMPKMNGSECLTEIKQSETLKHIPVIIYSTSYHEDVADVLYNHGAHYYIRKTDLTEIEKILKQVLTLLMKKVFERPSKKDFVLNLKI
jgi:CheY-like chemotaxis protein